MVLTTSFTIVLSSSTYNVIRPVLNFLLIFYDKISQAPKGTKKHQKALKSNNRFKIYQLKIHRHKFIKLKKHLRRKK